jgi:hypothetical protein
MKDFYVYVRSGSRTGFPVGPFGDKASAEAFVEPMRRYAVERIDPMAHFFEWGVAGVPREGLRVGIGPFNSKVGYQVPASVLSEAEVSA